MNFKVFVTVFIGLLAVNVSVQSPTLKDDDLKVIIVAALNNVLNMSTTLINDANAAVDNLEKNQDAIKDKIVAFAVDVGKQVNTLILKGIDGLREGATDDGKAVIDCIDAEQAQTEAAFSKVFGDIGTCAAGETPVVVAELRKILSQLGDLKDDIQGQTDTLSSCTDADLLCLISFATTIGETAKKIPTVLQGDIQELIELVKTIAGDVQGCAGEVINQIKSAAQDIFNEAVVCIKK